MAATKFKNPKLDPHPAASPLESPRITIDDLSNEILISIIRHLPVKVQVQQSIRPYGDRVIVNLMVSSKRFHKLAEPILYSHFIEEFTGNQKAPQLFLKRILSRPDLAARVQTYHGMASDNRHHDNHMDLSCFGEGEWSKVKARVDEVSRDAEEAAGWLASIKAGDWEALTALTLTLTPNIRHLEFEGWSYDNEVYPNLLRFLDRARLLQENGDLENPLSMSHVRSAQQDYWDTEGGMTINILGPLLALPSVEDFSAKMVADIHSDSDLRSIGKFPHIKHLTLDSACIAHDTLELFLKLFANLETLYYLHGFSGYEAFEPPKMMVALEHLKPCLRSLSVFNENMVGASLIETYPIGSLAGFEKLEKIHLDSGMLTGDRGEETVMEGFRSRQSFIDALPASIQDIKLENCEYNESLPGQISSLISHKLSRFPNLKKVDLGWEKIRYPDKPSPTEPFKHPGFTKEDAARLSLEFEAAGVEMVMKTLPPQPKHIRYLVKPDGWDKPDKFGFKPAPLQMMHVVNYPYEEYERLCGEHGCDLETGRPPGQWC